MPPTLIGTAATFLALHCIRGHLALWSDIYTKVSSQLPILMLTQYQYNSEGRSVLRVLIFCFMMSQYGGKGIVKYLTLIYIIPMHPNLINPPHLLNYMK